MDTDRSRTLKWPEVDEVVTSRAKAVELLGSSAFGPAPPPGSPFTSSIDVPGLLQLTGEAHFAARREMVPYFSDRRLRPWFPEIRQLAAEIWVPNRGIDAFATGFSSASARLVAGIRLPRNELAELAYQAITAGTAHRRHLTVWKLARAAQDALDNAHASECETPTPTLALSLLRDRASKDTSLRVMMHMLTIGVAVSAFTLEAIAPYALQRSPCDAFGESDLEPLLQRANVVPFMDRIAIADTVLEGCPIREGRRLRIDIAAADSEMSVGERALIFGLGARYCVGAPWVKLLVRASLEAWGAWADVDQHRR